MGWRKKPEPKRDHDNLRKIIRKHGFGDIEDKLMTYTHSSIRVETEAVEDESMIPIGASKIGGRPDLPITMDWVQVESNDELVSLPFIAQFDMADVKPYDRDNLLSDYGMLYFFADPWRAGNRAHRGKVVYFDGDKSTLIRMPFPYDIPLTPPNEWGIRYTACELTIIPEINLPTTDGIWRDLDIPLERKDEFYDLLESANYQEEYQPLNRLLGEQYGIPGDMRGDCITYNHPVFSNDTTRLTSTQRINKWRLLFQMDSDENADMMWSDNGTILFFIRHDDLKKRKFDDICFSFFSA